VVGECEAGRMRFGRGIKQTVWMGHWNSPHETECAHAHRFEVDIPGGHLEDLATLSAAKTGHLRSDSRELAGGQLTVPKMESYTNLAMVRSYLGGEEVPA
jgi:hypothetical protein